MGWSFTFKITLEDYRQAFLCPGKSPLISRSEYIHLFPAIRHKPPPPTPPDETPARTNGDAGDPPITIAIALNINASIALHLLLKSLSVPKLRIAGYALALDLGTLYFGLLNSIIFNKPS
jgi:hypothetical protein